MKTPIRQWSRRLLLRFSPRRVRLGLEGPTPIPGGEAKQLQVLVGRELCLFLSVDATRVPAKQRASFIALAVRRAAPFPDPAHEAAWSGAHAGVWYWSRSRVAELLGPQPLRVARVVPEAQYCGEPMAEGAQLLALARGFEGRAWKDAGLVADRWWAVPPSGEDWAAFLRGAGLRVMELPDAVEAPIGQTPWAQQRQGTRLALDDAGTWLRRGAVAAGDLDRARLLAPLPAWPSVLSRGRDFAA